MRKIIPLSNPDITVKAIYSGNYSDTMTKAMTALKGGTPPNLSVILSTEIFTLMDNDAIVPFDDLITTDQDIEPLAVAK